MKRIIITLVVIITFSVSHAQSPQFAVVRPNGTTYICPTFDSAYNKAVNDDFIYLPGGNFTFSYTFNKRLHIFGAGHHPDSSLVTGKSYSSSQFAIQSGATGSTFEGLQTSNNFYFLYTGIQVTNITIKRCRISAVVFNGSATTLIDSIASNIMITECIVDFLQPGNSKNNYFTKNLFRAGTPGEPGYIRESNFKNNIFIGTYFTPNNCIFENNIFMQPGIINTPCTNSFFNNLLVGAGTFNAGCPPNSITEVNTITVPTTNDVFVSFTPGPGYPYLDNYDLKPACPGNNAGTDGYDVGIYGSSSPTSLGWVPSNPHIYFKQVAAQTNTSGQLNIQFKVRTNN
ncbi:MAG: hypothetical protein ABIO79_14960 [Ferruginibacter sp.]